MTNAADNRRRVALENLSKQWMHGPGHKELLLYDGNTVAPELKMGVGSAFSLRDRHNNGKLQRLT
ncbi:hypothetical protein [Paeniglutamicibacter sp.]|uniref:hypothetical protein n=1 Tax=Paeniglutamicibacter sp. TaxID=1934391 RepID=UPI003988FA14